MPNPTSGYLYSYSDNGNPGNVSSPVLADNNGGWDSFSNLFAGANARGQNRIYGANQGGQLLSYSPTNPLSDEVIVGADRWTVDNFFEIFAGVNLFGDNRIYAVKVELGFFSPGGQLLSCSDDGTTGNVGHPVVVGADGWDWIDPVFAGKDSKGLGCIYGVNKHGNLLVYHDDRNPGNVGHPVVVGRGIWNDFSVLFAGANAQGQNRIYGVNKLGQLLSYSSTDPVSDEVIVGADGWSGFRTLFVGVNSAGQNRIYGVYG